MSEPFVGEIRIVGFNFAPRGWALCNGQLLPIRNNTALFSILGVTYGGDGKNTFALPNLMGRAAIHQGTGQGLTPRSLGEMAGEANVTLLQTQIPAHTHVANAASAAGDSTDPTGRVWASVTPQRGLPYLYSDSAEHASTLSYAALSAAGGTSPHNNMQPYLGMSFVIALEGVYPPRH